MSVTLDADDASVTPEADEVSVTLEAGDGDVWSAAYADAEKAPCPLSYSVMTAGRMTMAPRCLQRLHLDSES